FLTRVAPGGESGGAHGGNAWPQGGDEQPVMGAQGTHPSPAQHCQGLTPPGKRGAETSIPPCHPQLRLAALNVPLWGDMSGIRGADLQCYRQSQEAGLYGTFRAFLSAPSQQLVSIVKRTDRTLPIVNLKGQLLAKSWSSLFGGAALRGPIYSFNGRNVLADPLWPRRLAWHGSTPRGGHASRWDCQGWRNSGTAQGMASALGEGRLLAGQRHNCSAPLAVLCIEVAFPYRHMW
uniref:Collagenase NC10/endostatin domain-containing protein n=1 Tax=Serinus canaria TaxID=9135 RepID=A0A8C9MZ23_SERCA